MDTCRPDPRPLTYFRTRLWAQDPSAGPQALVIGVWRATPGGDRSSALPAGNQVELAATPGQFTDNISRLPSRHGVAAPQPKQPNGVGVTPHPRLEPRSAAP